MKALKMLKRLRQRACHHRFKYIAPIYRLSDRKVIACEYECEKCGAVQNWPIVKEGR